MTTRATPGGDSEAVDEIHGQRELDEGFDVDKELEPGGVGVVGEKGVAAGAPRKHACATPEKAAPASNTSGYEPAITLVIMAPEDPPMTYTLDASPWYLSSVYLTMLTMPPASPPPSCVRLAVFCTSQH